MMKNFDLAKKEFKNYHNDKSNHPETAKLGNIIPGNLGYCTYLFYGMLCDKDIRKMAHDQFAESFIKRVYALKEWANNDYSFTFKREKNWQIPYQHTIDSHELTGRLSAYYQDIDSRYLNFSHDEMYIISREIDLIKSCFTSLSLDEIKFIIRQY